MVSRNSIRIEQKLKGCEIEIPTSFAAAIFMAYAILVYWPVLLGQRFFWEDYFIKEYPIREFSFYMLNLRHTLPFWNPYSQAWKPFLADAQAGFWYPVNLLQIAIGHLIGATELSILNPEMMTIGHMALAGLGVFVLLKKEFRTRDIAAILGGLAFGFGTRMAAEQNHVVFVSQLALLPWETLLLMRSWRSWSYSIGLGLVLGISFLAGQQQVFLFIALFLASLTIWEWWLRRRSRDLFSSSLRLFSHMALAMVITAGIAAIQLLPLLQLTSLSLRQHLSYPLASMGSMHPFRFITFFVPKFFGEFPSYSVPYAQAYRSNGLWYWEGTFYWGVLAEILALFGIIRLSASRKTTNSRTRYVGFFIGFSIFAILYGMGSYGGIGWLFWRFVPIFDHIRMPNRMLWFVWFIGCLATAFGLEEILNDPALLREYRRYFYSAAAVFVILNILAVSGVFHLLIGAHHYLYEPLVMLHSLVASLAVLAFFYIFIEKKISQRWLLPCVILLMVADLYFVDFTWHRSTLDRETLVAEQAHSKPIVDFEQLHKNDHSKLLLLETPNEKQKDLNLGMFLRIPIEFSTDSNDLLADNPMRLVNIFPPVRDSIRRMEIMGVSMTVYSDGSEIRDSLALPLIKLYHHWTIARDRAETAGILNKPDFNFHDSVVLQTAPTFGPPAAQAGIDSLSLLGYSENRISISVRTSKPSVVLVNDLYYPAWKATVDGGDVKILRAFASLRAIPVSPGSHTIELQYDSSLFALGWKISAATLLLSVLMLVGLRKTKENSSRFGKRRSDHKYYSHKTTTKFDL